MESDPNLKFYMKIIDTILDKIYQNQDFRSILTSFIEWFVPFFNGEDDFYLIRYLN